MIEDKISLALKAFTPEQLDQIKTKLDEMVVEKQEAKKNASRFPPVASDLDSLAAMQDLDLSSLMREISRR